MTDMILILPVLGPALASVAAAVLGWHRSVAWVAVAASGVVLAVGVFVAVATADGTVLVLAGTLRADALTAVMLLVIGSVSVIATWVGVGYIDRELATGQTMPPGARRYQILVPLFVGTMAGAVLASNLGVLWAAVEATTIVTAFLVGHHGGRRAVEATWKYVIICSVGIALAYFGTVLVYYASQHAGSVDGSLEWTVLVSRADRLDPGVMQIAVVLLVLGFGTKAGLVPMHSWLPDAHSQAPAPVSALMSGVLLPVAAYALLRYRVIATAALDPALLRTLLLVVGIGSVAAAASLMIVQRDYKRLLAYSSIEHMGLVMIGMAVGTPLAVAALLLHILGHGLAKAVLFCASGEVLDATGTTQIAGVRGLLTRRPALAGAFGLGIAALLGLPPFSLFASELALARATADEGLLWVVAVALVLLLVVFIAVARPVALMLLGGHAAVVGPAALEGGAQEGGAQEGGAQEGGAQEGGAQEGGAILVATRRPAVPVAPLIAGLVLLAALGVLDPLDGLLESAAAVVGTR
jgi:hydrogenase-4 component F